MAAWPGKAYSLASVHTCMRTSPDVLLFDLLPRSGNLENRSAKKQRVRNREHLVVPLVKNQSEHIKTFSLPSTFDSFKRFRTKVPPTYSTVASDFRCGGSRFFGISENGSCMRIFRFENFHQSRSSMKLAIGYSVCFDRFLDYISREPIF